LQTQKASVEMHLEAFGGEERQAKLQELLQSDEQRENQGLAMQEAVERQEQRIASLTEMTLEREAAVDRTFVAQRCYEVTKPEDEDWRREEIKGVLPAEQVRADLDKALEFGKVVIVSGGTGSGKSTQLPQYILDDWREWKVKTQDGGEPPLELEVGNTVEVEYEEEWFPCEVLEVADDEKTITAKYFEGGDEEPDVDVKSRVRTRLPAWAISPPRIVVTQPRRIAATSLAERVAYERYGEPGGEVGYSVRGDTIMPESDSGTIEFCTVGTLLRRVVSDPLLSRYNVVVLDEVHERDLMTDFVLNLLKEVLGKRPDLRLVLMSATLDVQTFINYLPGCTVIQVPTGTRYPVEEIHLNDKFFESFSQTAGLLKNEAENREATGNDQRAGSHEFDFSDNSSSVAQSMVQKVNEMVDSDEDVANAWAEYCDESLRGIKDPALHSMEALRVFLARVKGKDEEDEEDDVDNDGLPSAAALREQIQQLTSHSDEMRQSWKEYTEDKEEDEETGWSVQDLLAFLNMQGVRPWNVQRASWEVTSSSLWWGGDRNDKSFLELTQQVIMKVVPELLDHDVGDDEFGTGSILCFLPGWAEIKALADRLEQSPEADKLWVVRLHSTVSKEDQQQVFEQPDEGQVKVILATNIAESSVTINDVRVVVDTGLHRELSYDAKRRMSTLETVWICQSNAVQRKGRAGRVREGRVYRLYSKDQFESVPWRPSPEMQRCNLAQACLQTIALGRDPRAFLASAPDPPPVAAVESAMAELTLIDAVKGGVPPKMLPVGQVLARMPLEPLLGRAMMLGTLFGIPQMAAALIAVSAGRSPFIMPPDMKKESKEARRQYCSWSDTVGALRALVEFEKVVQDKGEHYARRWAQHYYLNYERLLGFSKVKFQLMKDVQRSGLLGNDAAEGMDPDDWFYGEEGDDDSNAAIFEAGELQSGMKKDEWLATISETDREVDDERLLIGLLCAAYPTNVACREQAHHNKHRTSTGAAAIIDMRSVNSRIGDSNEPAEDLPSPSWWAYSTLRMFNSRLSMSDTTLTSAWHVALFAGLRAKEEPELQIDSWINVKCDSEATKQVVVRLREEIRQAIIWSAVAASYDTVAAAATERAKSLLNIVSSILLGQEPSEEDLEFVQTWELPDLEEGGTLAASEDDWEAVQEALWKKTVPELKVLLREMGAKVGGRKGDLVERCTNALIYGAEEEQSEEYAEESMEEA